MLKRHLLVLGLLLLSTVSAKAGTIGRMIEIFEEDPSRFIFNIVFVVILLVLGGVFAGKAGLE